MVRLPIPLPKVYFLTALCQPLKIIQENFNFFCNINGLSSKTFGDELQDYDCLNMINNFDFIILSETWKRSNIQIEGFETFVTNMKTGKYVGNSGGLALIYKLKFDDGISIPKSSPNFLWFTIKNQCSGSQIEKDLYVCGTNIPPQNSCYFLTDLSEN